MSTRYSSLLIDNFRSEGAEYFIPDRPGLISKSNNVTNSIHSRELTLSKNSIFATTPANVSSDRDGYGHVPTQYAQVGGVIYIGTSQGIYKLSSDFTTVTFVTAIPASVSVFSGFFYYSGYFYIIDSDGHGGTSFLYRSLGLEAPVGASWSLVSAEGETFNSALVTDAGVYLFAQDYDFFYYFDGSIISLYAWGLSSDVENLYYYDGFIYAQYTDGSVNRIYSSSANTKNKVQQVFTSEFANGKDFYDNYSNFSEKSANTRSAVFNGYLWYSKFSGSLIKICRFDGSSSQLVTTIKYLSDVSGVRFFAVSNRLYLFVTVGSYGSASWAPTRYVYSINDNDDLICEYDIVYPYDSVSFWNLFLDDNDHLIIAGRSEYGGVKREVFLSSLDADFEYFGFVESSIHYFDQHIPKSLVLTFKPFTQAQIDSEEVGSISVFVRFDRVSDWGTAVITVNNASLLSGRFEYIFPNSLSIKHDYVQFRLEFSVAETFYTPIHDPSLLYLYLEKGLSNAK